jgi:hypothetical protein
LNQRARKRMSVSRCTLFVREINFVCFWLLVSY